MTLDSITFDMSRMGINIIKMGTIELKDCFIELSDISISWEKIIKLKNDNEKPIKYEPPSPIMIFAG